MAKPVASPKPDMYLVGDTGNSRVQVFDSASNFLFKFGSFGADDGEFSNPFGVVGDSEDRIIVGDTYNHRVQVFQILPTNVE